MAANVCIKFPKISELWRRFKILVTPGNSNAEEESGKSEDQRISKSLTKNVTSWNLVPLIMPQTGVMECFFINNRILWVKLKKK